MNDNKTPTIDLTALGVTIGLYPFCWGWGIEHSNIFGTISIDFGPLQINLHY